VPALSEQPTQGPPAAMPPPLPGSQPSELARPVRPTFSQWFRTSPWWHKVLVALPLLLVAAGGLLGALTGVLLAGINQAVLRSRLGSPAKVAVCIFVIVVGGLACLLVVAIFTTLLGLNGTTH
jgi:hypothetical protein